MKETKEILAFVLSLGNAVGKSLEDGKVGLTDLMYFVDAMRKAGDAFEGAGGAVVEWAAMTDAQKEELKLFVTQEFDIPQDSLEAAIESGLKIAIDVAYMVTKWFK